MNRDEFTKNLCSLILDMVALGERPLIDYVKRSTEEQKRLFAAKLTKCDGVNNISWHQKGKAADIYFMSEDASRLEDPVYGWDHWHKVWELKYSGQKMIDWDKGHFEVS